MSEPKRNKDLHSLEPYVRDRVEAMMAAMRSRGFDPVVFEARRSLERQRWLYGIGRTHSKTRKPVTWTMKSKHIHGKACDIVSASRLWDWPEFFVALRQEARKVGLTTLSFEACHVQWGK